RLRAGGISATFGRRSPKSRRLRATLRSADAASWLVFRYCAGFFTPVHRDFGTLLTLQCSILVAGWLSSPSLILLARQLVGEEPMSMLRLAVLFAVGFVAMGSVVYSDDAKAPEKSGSL